jgi:hypothetical protein
MTTETTGADSAQDTLHDRLAHEAKDFIMSTRPPAKTFLTAHQVQRADKAQQIANDAKRRIEAQRVAAVQTTAKIQRLKALRMERDAIAQREQAEADLAAAAAAPDKKKPSRRKAPVE